MSDWVRWHMTASNVGLGSLVHGSVQCRTGSMAHGSV
jgi:hypothetical protein